MPDLDDIIANPKGWGMLPKQPATLYAVVTGLAMKATVKTLEPILAYADRMADKGYGEFAALLLRDMIRRDQTLMGQPAFVKVLGGPLGQLIEGRS